MPKTISERSIRLWQVLKKTEPRAAFSVNFVNFFGPTVEEKEEEEEEEEVTVQAGRPHAVLPDSSS